MQADIYPQTDTTKIWGEGPMTNYAPFLAGLRGRCPRCGKGHFFSAYLKIADECDHCGLDFRGEDAGDGPAVFVTFFVGFILVPMALALELAASLPVWVHMIVWFPLAIGLTMLILVPFKGVFYALQWQHGARQAGPQDD